MGKIQFKTGEGVAPFITKKRIIGIILAVLVIITIIASITIIPTGYTGVKATFGQISSKKIGPGLHFVIPFAQKIQKVNNKQQDIRFSDKIWGESSERTVVYAQDVTITYKIAAEKSAYLYANVSTEMRDLVTSELVSSSIKSAMREYNVGDVTNREKVEATSRDKLNLALTEKYGKDAVIIVKITISQMDFEDSYNEAIAQKQIAQQEYEKTLIENQTKVEKAQAEAEALLIKSTAEAGANRTLNASLNKNILEYYKIQKWDGVLPKSTSGNTFMGIE